jgi:hypothetical protein
MQNKTLVKSVTNFLWNQSIDVAPQHMWELLRSMVIVINCIAN